MVIASTIMRLEGATGANLSPVFRPRRIPNDAKTRDGLGGFHG